MTTDAKRADRHALYEIAVQQPLLILDLIENRFNGEPLVLREDFCGTANLASTWVANHPRRRRAIAIDSDSKVLAYAERRHRRSLGAAANRLRLIEGDVMRCAAKADVIASLNFSHFIYKTRRELLKYLRHARRCLASGGMMLLDLYGGPGAMAPGIDERPFGDFTYLWEQASYDPLTAVVRNHIHFRFPDGSERRRAFTYDWRLWTLAELREAVIEAGFRDIEVWYEGGEAFERDIDTAEYDAWVAYLIARP